MKPIVKAAKRIADHLPNILNYFKHGVTNSMAEGFNSKIQYIKAAARGFKLFKNYRNIILFYCGKLDLFPATHKLLRRTVIYSVTLAIVNLKRFKVYVVDLASGDIS